MDLRSGSLISLVLLVLDIIAIVEIFKSSKDMTAKLLWTILILLFPLVGVVLYYLLGRGSPVIQVK